jgi:hypothetical protein
MKRLLTLALIFFAAILQSCDERINPTQNIPAEVKPPTKTEILTANPWQYNEVTLKGGSVTKVSFSKIANPVIGINSDFAKATVTYRADGTAENNIKGIIKKAKWQFLNNETQIQIIEEDGTKILYNIDTLTKDNFNQNNVVTKASFNDDAFWIGFITNLGFPNNITEFSYIFKLVPLK